MTQFRYQPLDFSRSEFRLLYPIQHADLDASLSAPNPELKTVLTKDESFITPDLSMEFELRTVSLDNDFEPVYTALSYVWGDTATSKSITVNGCTFAITKNLNIALRHLQYDSIFPAIWIDAICINQKDNEEKNNQIPRMSRIYSCARDVLIWLGPGTSGDHYAVMMLYQFQALYLGFSLQILPSNRDMESEDVATWMSRKTSGLQEHPELQEILRLYENIFGPRATLVPQATPGSQTTSRSRVTSVAWRNMCSHDYDDTWTVESPNIYPCKMLEIMANAIATVNAEAPGSVKIVSDIDHFASWCVSSLLFSEWWTRIWVIQEFTSARSCHFQLGLCRLPPSTILLSRIFINCFRRHFCRSTDIAPCSQKIGGISTHFLAYGEGGEDRKFFNILRDTYVFNGMNLYCWDARDRIFALISLAEKDCKSLGIQADYHKPTREVYIDVAQSLLHAGELDILSFCYGRKSACLEDSAGPSIPDECRLDLPSWVPDWSVEIAQPHSIFRDRSRSLQQSSYRTTIVKCSNLETSQDKVNRCPNSIVLTGELLDEITQVGSMCEGYEENPELGIEPPLTSFERLASVSADIEAWSNSARHNQTTEVFAPYPHREQSRTILGLVHHEILCTIGEFLFLKQLRPLRHLRRCRSFVLRHFHEVRDSLILGSRNHRERIIHEAVWRVPVWNLEYSTKGDLREATKSSEARYQTSLHLGLYERYWRNVMRLNDEVNKHGLLQSVRFRILSNIDAVKARFHIAMAVMCCRIPAHRLARACCIPPSVFWAIIPVRTPSRWVNEAIQFASLYVVAMRQGPPNRVVQTKRGYIGVATASSQPGDRICVFSGSRVAHILRERGNGQDGYTLIGDAFVYEKTHFLYPKDYALFYGLDHDNMTERTNFTCMTSLTSSLLINFVNKMPTSTCALTKVNAVSNCTEKSLASKYL